jgi:hypothetical protein
MHGELHAHSLHVSEKQKGLALVLQFARAYQVRLLAAPAALARLQSSGVPRLRILPMLHPEARAVRIVSTLVNPLQGGKVGRGCISASTVDTPSYATGHHQPQEFPPPVFARHRSSSRELG